MTPHQQPYFQGKESPHDLGQPNPITFLTVPPDSKFVFHIQCNTRLLQHTAPELLADSQWQSLVQAAFQHAFNWLGFGAKTAVGYGTMRNDEEAYALREKARSDAQQKAEQLAEQNRLDSMPPDERAREEANKQLQEFEKTLKNAKAAGPFDPTGTFPQKRREFMKLALSWEDPENRESAAKLLADSAKKTWGKPKKKERWKELQEAMSQLRGEN